MAPRYDEAPEVALHTLPEVHHPPAAPEAVNPYGQPHHQIYSPVKHDDPQLHSGGYGPATAMTTTAYGYNDPNGYGGGHSESERRQGRATLCGCTLLVFILSLIIALLSATVIGLAAGTGVEASRASNAESSLAAMKAAATSTNTAPASTSTSDLFNSLDRNCTSDSQSVSGTTYSSFFFNKATYTIYCNQDTPNAPLQSLFVGNFDDCIDACSSFSFSMPLDFSNSSATNQTCAGVTFVPAWTNRTLAEDGTAPGNCYLKPGPQNETSLYSSNSGQETHAAIVDSSQ